MNDLKEKLDKVRSRIASACQAAGRDGDSVTLLAVSKQQPADRIRQLHALGQRHFGENYLQEAVQKQAQLSDLDIIWHFIGPLQSNKTREVAQQYEASPYPRWTSVGVVTPARMRRALGGYFSARELAFLDRPFDVLIAGCGTGQQAVQAALAYGPEARVLAIDLSAASLAYAARMAERFGAINITFAQADLQDSHRPATFNGDFHRALGGGFCEALCPKGRKPREPRHRCPPGSRTYVLQIGQGKQSTSRC